MKGETVKIVACDGKGENFSLFSYFISHFNLNYAIFQLLLQQKMTENGLISKFPLCNCSMFRSFVIKKLEKRTPISVNV